MTTPSKVVQIAERQIGYCESPANSNRTKYGKAYGMNGVSWCDIFRWWIFDKAGLSSISPKSARVDVTYSLFVQKYGAEIVLPYHGTSPGNLGKKVSKEKAKEMRAAAVKKIKKGDIVWFDFGTYSGYRYHISGVVVGVKGNYIICIEGNTSSDEEGSQSNGGMVCRRSRHYSMICAAVRPKYPGTQAESKKHNLIFPKRGYFKKGDSGEQVELMQRYLNHANKGAVGYTLKLDGVFGDATERSCKFMQEVRHLVVDGEFGQKSLAECKTSVTKPMMAVNFGIMIAKDNTFTYGVGQRAHRYGCYFCQTNVGPKKKLKEKQGEPHYVKDKDGKTHTYEKTYCCNPFVTACYAHGAEIEDILKACESGSGFGLSVKSCTRFKGIKKVGACKSVAFGTLQVGDIILCEHHMWMYTGGDWLVEASGEGWGVDSIAHKRGAKARYAKYQTDKTAYVVRYKG